MNSQSEKRSCSLFWSGNRYFSVTCQMPAGRWHCSGCCLLDFLCVPLPHCTDTTDASSGALEWRRCDCQSESFWEFVRISECSTQTQSVRFSNQLHSKKCHPVMYCTVAAYDQTVLVSCFLKFASGGVNSLVTSLENKSTLKFSIMAIAAHELCLNTIFNFVFLVTNTIKDILFIVVLSCHSLVFCWLGTLSISSVESFIEDVVIDLGLLKEWAQQSPIPCC